MPKKRKPTSKKVGKTITLLKYTEQGLKTIKESPSRLERAKQLLKSLGGELGSFHAVSWHRARNLLRRTTGLLGSLP